jgi:hypothetical protein
MTYMELVTAEVVLLTVVDEAIATVVVMALLEVVEVLSVLETICADVVEVALVEVTEDGGSDPEGEP